MVARVTFISIWHPSFIFWQIVDPFGGLKYSIKMLSKEGRSSKKFTNSNGRTIYGECETPCSNKTIELDDIYEGDDEAKRL